MMNVMGTVYQSLGLTTKAEPLLRRALEIRQRILGPRNPDTLQSESDLAVAVLAESHLARGGEVVPGDHGDSPPGTWPRAS